MTQHQSKHVDGNKNSSNSSSNKHIKRSNRNNSNSLTSFLSGDGTATENRKNYSNRCNRNSGKSMVPRQRAILADERP